MAGALKAINGIMPNKKIAFLFLVYDEINHEELWHEFFKHVDKTKYNIYIHYKYKRKLKYFENYKLKNCISTKYADVSIIHAFNLLLKTAFTHDPENYKFISLSQACVPLKSFDYVYQFLTKDDSAHFNIAPQNQCFPRCNSLLKYLPKEKIQKTSNWFILNRPIAEKLFKVDNDTVNALYKKIQAPEEHYFITEVFRHNLQNQILTTNNSANGATTFTNWTGMDYKYVSQKNLKNYDAISSEELLYLIHSPCLFGRKFNKNCALSDMKYDFSEFISSRCKF
jgi:hypothetical protein